MDYSAMKKTELIGELQRLREMETGLPGDTGKPEVASEHIGQYQRWPDDCQERED